jgi:hypothetical protein
LGFEILNRSSLPSKKIDGISELGISIFGNTFLTKEDGTFASSGIYSGTTYNYDVSPVSPVKHKVVFERGVGETQACGSGACAAAIIGQKTRNLSQKIKVNFNEGFLEAETDLSSGKVSLTGTANYRAKAVTLKI